MKPVSAARVTGATRRATAAPPYLGASLTPHGSPTTIEGVYGDSQVSDNIGEDIRQVAESVSLAAP